MADDRSGDKKHEATDHRRQKARDEGNVARSQDLSSAALLLVGIMLLDYTGPRMFQMMISFVTEELSRPLDWDSDARTAVLQFIKLLTTRQAFIKQSSHRLCHCCFDSWGNQPGVTYLHTPD